MSYSDEDDVIANEVEYWTSLGNLAQVRKAVSAGSDVNAAGHQGYTAMHAAAENNHVEVLKFLVANGAQVNSTLDTGETPLDMARLSDSQDATNYLSSL